MFISISKEIKIIIIVDKKGNLVIMRELYYIFLASLFSLLLASPDIRCATTTTWAPLTTSQENKIAGIGVDYWKIVKAKLHIQQKCQVINSWSEILEGIKKNQFDISLSLSFAFTILILYSDSSDSSCPTIL